MFARPAQKTPIAGRGSYPAPPVKKKVPHVVKEVCSKPEVQTVVGNFPVADLPYNVKERRVVEHRVRNPHRRYLPDDLIGVTAWWTEQDVGMLPWKEGGAVITKSEAKGSGILPVAAVTITKDKQDTCVNVRAVIIPEAEKEGGKTITKRVQVIAAASDTNVSLYGGVIPDARHLNDEQLTSRLATLIKEQSGADLSSAKWVKVLHIHYSSSPPTIIYAPILSSSPAPVFSPQVTPASPTNPEDTYHVTPVRFNLATVIDYEVHSTTPHDTLEFCMAVDAVHEWGKRDMAEKILEVLRIRGEEARKKVGEDMLLSEKLGAKKRKRDEEDERRMKKREDRDRELKQKWIEEDEGKTDEEKRVVMRERQEILKGIRAQDAADDESRKNHEKEEDQQDGQETTYKQKVQVIDQSQLEAFQYFDRPNEGSITRLTLQNILLCTINPITLADINTLLNLPYLPRRQEHLPYRKLAAQTVEKVVEIVPETPNTDV